MTVQSFDLPTCASFSCPEKSSFVDLQLLYIYSCYLGVHSPDISVLLIACVTTVVTTGRCNCLAFHCSSVSFVFSWQAVYGTDELFLGLRPLFLYFA